MKTLYRTASAALFFFYVSGFNWLPTLIFTLVAFAVIWKYADEKEVQE